MSSVYAIASQLFTLQKQLNKQPSKYSPFTHYSTPEPTKLFFTMKYATSRQDYSQQNNCSLTQYNRIDHIITKPFTIHNCAQQQDCLEYTRQLNAMGRFPMK